MFHAIHNREPLDRSHGCGAPPVHARSSARLERLSDADEPDHWLDLAQMTPAYTLAILLLGGSAPLGGWAVARWGPRRVGVLAGVLYGLGSILAGKAAGRMWLLYLGYAVVGAVGLGFTL
jgi:MFS family permease